MIESLRPPAQAVVACLPVAIAEVAWTYGTGFATAEESLWIVASWGLIAAVLALAARIIFPPTKSIARVRLYLIAPSLLLALRGEFVTSEPSGILLTIAVLGGVVLFVLLATRRPTALGRIWLLALFCGGVSTGRLALWTIEGITMQAVLGVHPGRTTEVAIFALIIGGLAALAWSGKWEGRSFVLFGLVPSLVITGVFIAQVAVRPPVSPEFVESAPDKPSVVIVVLDAWRRDALSALGGPPGLTPNLDRFARRSTLYTNAYSNGAYSLPGHASLFSGLLPSDHGAHPPGLPVRHSVRLIAEQMRDLGYSPYGYSANPVYLAPWTGLQRGFTRFYSDGRDRFGYYPTAAPLFRLMRIRPIEQFWWPAADFLAAVKPIVSTQGTALFLNLMECHGPRPEFANLDEPSAYQETMRELDRSLGEFLQVLDALPNAVVVITSDHGEFLGEHGHDGHGLELYEEGIQIPLIVRFPGQRAGNVDPRRVSLMDVPTILRAGIAGAQEPSSVSLPGEPRVIAETWSPRPGGQPRPSDGSPASRAVYLGHHKLIEHHDGFIEVFDLSTDPQEKVNLVTKDPAFANALISLIQRAVPPMRPGPARRPAPDVPPDVLERMRSLGYIK